MQKNTHTPNLRCGHIALAALTATFMMGLSHQAMAACDTDLSGKTVCSGNTTTGFIALDSELNIIVEDTGTITGSAIVNAPDNGNNANATVQIQSGAKLTNNGTIENTKDLKRDNYGVSLNGSKTTLDNTGSISSTVSGTKRAYGVIATSFDDDVSFKNVHIVNESSGNIYATTTGTSRAVGVYAGEGIASMTIDNYGSISGTGNSGANYAAGIGSDDDTAMLIVNNKTTGTITGTGNAIAYAVGGNAENIRINNDGTIVGNYDGAYAVTPNVANNTALAAIAIFGGSDDEAANANITNSTTGKILGNVNITDFAAAGTSTAPTTVGNPARPVATKDTRDSAFTNEGLVVGNFLYGAGKHVLDNTGTITGGITVEQSYGGTLNSGVGAASFTLTNDGELDGDITIHDRTDSRNLITLFGTDFAGSIVADGAGNDAVSFQNSMSITRVQNFRTLNLNDSTVTVTGAGVSLQDGATINTTIFASGGSAGSPSTDLGHLTFTSGTLTLAGLTIITPTTATVVKSGDTYQVASAVTGGSIAATDSALIDWTASRTSGELLLSATVRDVADVTGITKPGIATLNGLFGAAGEDPDLDALGGAVQTLAEDSDVVKAAKQLSPETNFATQQAAITLNNAIGQHIDTRLSSVGATGSSQGYTNAPYGLGMKPQQTDPNRSNLGGSLKDDPDFVAPRSAALWGQAFGAGMNQNERQDVDGYDARIYGLMVGYDNWISPDVRLGIAGGYANTRIDGEGDTNQNHTDIDSYLIQAYGAVKGSGWYATGRTGFTWHDYDTVRSMTEPLEDSAKGSHNGDQFNASIEVGAPMAHSGTIITPVASLTYSRLHQDGYSETSDGAMALAVGSQNNDSFVSGLGVKGLVPIANDTVIEGRALWLHEFADNAQVVNASFAAGGGTFTAAGPGVGRDSADLGIGMLAQIGFNSTFEINYDANVREDYLAHVGSARVDIHF